MKSVYSKISVAIVLALSALVYADDPPPGETPYLNTDNECAAPMGFISAYNGSSIPPRWETRGILGVHPLGGYYSTFLIYENGAIGSNSTRVYWAFNNGQWRWNVTNSTSLSISSCLADWRSEVWGLTNQQRENIPTLYDYYFNPPDYDIFFDILESFDETQAGHCEGAEPVSLINGEYTTSVTDVVIPAKGIPIAITRTYGSLREYNGRFGYGWDLNYNMRVFEIAGGETVLLRDGRGDKYNYTIEDGTNRFTRPDRKNYIRYNGTGADYPYSLIENTGLEYHFDEYGLLAVIEDRIGNTLTFSYELSGGVPVKSSIIGKSDYFMDTGERDVVGMDYKLTTITDSLGRVVTLNYNSDGLLDTIVDFENRTWSYGYDSLTNDLLTVTNPATTEYPTGLTTTYVYDDTDHPHGLTAIYDGENDPAVNPSAVAYIVNDYNSNGKVISQRYGPEQDTGDPTDLDNSEFVFDYTDSANNIVTVKSRKKIEDNSNVIHNSITQSAFNNQGQTLSEIVSTDTGATNPSSYETTYTYTANNEIETAEMPKGNGAYYEYDNHGHIQTVSMLDDVDNPAETITRQFNFANDVLVSSIDPKGNQTKYVHAYGMEFDGADDYIDLPVDTLENVTDEFSVSLWFNAQNVTGYKDLISIGANVSYDAGTNLAVYSGGFRYHVMDNASASPTWSNFSASIGTNQWYHVIFTFTKTAVVGYLNGQPIGSNSLSFTGNFTNSQLDTHSIGKFVKFADFSGAIDNVMIFDKPLTAEDVSELYNDGTGIDRPGYLASNCVAFWKLDDKAGNSTVTEEMGNYNGAAYQNTENISCEGIVAGALLHEIILPQTTVAAWNGATLQMSLNQPITSFTYYDDPDDIKYGLLKMMTAPDGLVVEYQYYDDSDTYGATLPQNGNYGRLKKTIIDPTTAAITTEYKYDALGHVSWVKDAQDNISESVSNGLDQLITAVAPVLSGQSTGYETAFYYNKNRKLQRIEQEFTDGESGSQVQQVEYEYNLLDALKLVRDSLSYETESFYDDNENLIAVQDAESKAQSVGNEYYTNMQYNERDLLFKTTDAEGHETAYEYDDNGNLWTITDAKNQTTTYTYDNFDRLIETEYPDTSTEGIGYDVSGNIVWTKTRAGDEFHYDFDVLGRLSRKIIDESGSDVLFDNPPVVTSGTWTNPDVLGTYSENCLASTTTGDTCQFSFSVAAGDYIVYLWWPTGEAATAADNVAVNLNDSGTTTVYVDQSATSAQWHKLGSFTFGSTVTIEVEAQGSGKTTYADAVRLVPVNLPVTEYYYDIAGRILRVDENSNLTDYNYDSLGRLQAVVDQESRTVEYAHDDLSRRTRLDYPDGTYVKYFYDEMSRLTEVQYDGTLDSTENPVILAHYDYDELSRRKGLYYNYDGDSLYNEANVDGHIAYDYEDKTTDPATDNNLSNRLHYIDQDIDNDGTNDITAAYTYDKAGNVKSKSLDGDDPHEYLYDTIYQLTEDEDTQTNGDKYNWVYNVVGNWLQFKLDDTTQTEFSTFDSTNTTENVLNQYSSVGPTGNRVDYAYSANGNLTSDGIQTYTYNAQNRLLSVEFGDTLCEYGYDTAGRRISKKITDTTGPTLTAYTEYAYDGDQVIAEYDDDDLDGDVDYLARKFIYGPGIDEPICMIVYDSQGAETGRYFYHFDALGSVIALSQYNSGNGYAAVVEQYEYSAFGETTVTLDGSTDNPYRFTGRRWDDETGLYYYRARVYSPELGRFLQPDPIGYTDSMNLYAYVGNNPMVYTDPSGLCKDYGLEASLGGFFNQLGSRLGGLFDLKGHINNFLNFGRMFNQTMYNIGYDSGIVYDTLYEFGYMSNEIYLDTIANKTDRELGAMIANVTFDMEVTAVASKLAAYRTSNIKPGTKVYRVWGNGAGPNGRSWTTVNPNKVNNFRNAAGLPTQNTGRFVSEGILKNTKGVISRKALQLGTNAGGLPELVVSQPQTQIVLQRVSGANPPF